MTKNVDEVMRICVGGDHLLKSSCTLLVFFERHPIKIVPEFSLFGKLFDKLNRQVIKEGLELTTQITAQLHGIRLLFC